MFQVSLLKRNIGTHAIEGALLDIGELEESPSPVAILDRKIVKQGNKVVTKVLIQ